MSLFITESKKLNPSAMVELYKLDASFAGGSTLAFTTETSAGEFVSFGSEQYLALPVRVSGMSISGTGTIQTPTMTISNTDGLIQEFINTWGDLDGCRLTRWRTYAKFLDDGEAPDPSVFYGPDVYQIDRKSSDTPEEISWELSVMIDKQGVYIGRTVIRDTCMSRYRYFNPNTGQFEYAKAECPYAGARYFNKSNVEVFTASEDSPARNVGCCTARFGEGAELPFGGFPGILRGVL